MEILLTGSTAAHVSRDKNSRTVTFPGLINRALVDARHNVTWIEPSVSMSKEYVNEFDAVVVGIAPPTSTSAHRIYGSLSVIYHAWELGNLHLLIDAPEPRRIWAGLTAINKNPDDLVKDFFSKRSEYRKTRDKKVFDRIYGAVDYLYNREWPRTFYPKLPWMSFASVSSYIPQVSGENLVGLCFDRDFVESQSSLLPVSNPAFWVADATNTSWTKRQEDLISLPVEPLKSRRWEYAEESLEKLSNSIGCLASVYRNGDPWWSPSFSQALHVGVPVVTDWLLSSMLGDSWRVLPAAVEDMTVLERSHLVSEQKKSYCSSLLTWKDSVDLLSTSLID